MSHGKFQQIAGSYYHHHHRVFFQKTVKQMKPEYSTELTTQSSKALTTTCGHEDLSDTTVRRVTLIDPPSIVFFFLSRKELCADSPFHRLVPLSSAKKQIPWAKFIIQKFLVRLTYLVLILAVVS